MYTFAHPIEDALEDITHSICTLEFEDQRPSTTGCWTTSPKAGLLQPPVPRQIEFARLNLTYVVLSKRKLIQLVDEKHVAGWDDPRLPTLVGARRRGFTAEGFKRFAERIGVSKADSWIDMSVLEDCMREDLNEAAERRVAVLDPLKLIITNYPGRDRALPRPTTRSTRSSASATMPFGRELWIEREDFMETRSGLPPPLPGQHGPPALRLRRQSAPAARRTPTATSPRCCANTCPKPSPAPQAPTTTRSRATCTGSPSSTPVTAEVRLYDRLFAHAYPGARREGDPEGLERDFTDDINPQQPAGHHRPARTRAACRPAGSPLPVRAPRLLLSPTGWIPATARRCSTAPSPCATPGRNKAREGPSAAHRLARGPA